MAYRFKLNEPMQRGFQRIATEQIDRATKYLDAHDESAATSIHETRKCLKRTRALLRFCRPNMEADTFKHLNANLRDIGRLLSKNRDADVLDQTIERLALAGELKRAIVDRLRLATTSVREAAAGEQGDDAAYRECITRLALVRDEVSTVGLKISSSSIDTSGLAHSFDTCRSAFEPAFDGADDLAVHEWRKTVQTHWRHMQLISRAWPEYCEARIAEARLISVLIGEVRDLGMLTDFASGSVSKKLTPTMLGSIKALVIARQNMLKSEAQLRGARLLTERSKGLCRRIESYWDAAADLKRARKRSNAAD